MKEIKRTELRKLKEGQKLILKSIKDKKIKWIIEITDLLNSNIGGILGLVTPMFNIKSEESKTYFLTYGYPEAWKEGETRQRVFLDFFIEERKVKLYLLTKKKEIEEINSILAVYKI